MPGKQRERGGKKRATVAWHTEREKGRNGPQLPGTQREREGKKWATVTWLGCLYLGPGRDNVRYKERIVSERGEEERSERSAGDRPRGVV